MNNRKTQQRFPLPLASTNIDPSGDPLISRNDTDGILRIAYQNVHGVHNNGFSIPTELEAIESLNIDIMGMSETNCPWTPKSRSEFNFMMNQRFQSSRTIFTSSPPTSNGRYQPGGNLLTITGKTTGRITDSGSDPWGRFCWYCLQGRQDEGVIVITAYRVCQHKHTNTGPHTAHRQQYILMRLDGETDPDPRQRLLTDLELLIRTHREKGYRPILLMDANGDYLAPLNPDTSFAKFIHTTYLQDPFYEKFNMTPRTYLHGTKQIDYILVDPILTPSIKSIGYLGTHMGADSDHVMAFVDFDEAQLFHGVVNRPVMFQARDILISQTDKVLEYTSLLETSLEDHSFSGKVAKLAHQFALYSSTTANIAKYNAIYGEFLDIARSAAKKVGRKKYGYNRSPTLTSSGQLLLIHKHVLDCRRRKAPLTPSILQRCSQHDVSIARLQDMTIPELRREIRTLRQDHWENCKRSEANRSDWLAAVAKDRSRAQGDPNWEKKLKDMRTIIKTNALNRKLTSVTKGPRGVLDRLQVPTHTWFHSPSLNELYHYDAGVFEAYPAYDDTSFHTYHTIKILPDNAIRVTIATVPPHNRLTITSRIHRDEPIWSDVGSQENIEICLLARNRRHLEQTAREQGISTGPPLTTLRENFGFNPFSEGVLHGNYVTHYDLTPEMQAFFEALKSNKFTNRLPPIDGVITSEDFQRMFSIAKERTSSDPRTLNYSLWKCIATSDSVSSLAAILLSLPFMYGFVNSHWTHMTDFMIEKKQGVRQIHRLRIIGKVAAEFNTCLKFLIGHKAMHNFEDSDPCDEQHGFRPMRSSVDAAFLKLLTFESACMHRATICSVQHDMSAHFDRMYPAMTSIYASCYKVDKSIMLSIGKTIRSLQRNVETSLGISEKSYRQLKNFPDIGGMVQGKADVPQLSTQQSDAMLKAHKSLTRGLSIPNPIHSRSISHHSVGFADDTDNHTSVDSNEDTPIVAVVRQGQDSAQVWNNIVDICGGLIALHKCTWHLIAWCQAQGYMALVQDPGTTLTLHNTHGTPTVIRFLLPHEPNVGLGFLICPDGNQSPQFFNLLKDVNTVCARISCSYLTESETRQALHQRLLPKLRYVLHLTSFSSKQCDTINTVIRQTFLPRLRLNRHFPDSVLYGPVCYGGMAFPEIYTLQLSTQLEYLIKQLRWDHTVANDYLVALDSTQLHTGVGPPLLEITSPPIKYVTNSSILSLRGQLDSIGAGLWVEDKWLHPLQRENDAFLMDRFLQIPQITTLQLKQANEVRLYLRVLTIADLADPSGRFIPDNSLTGEWQGGSDLHWPYQALPPPKFWATFRYCLRHTFCTSTSPHQPVDYGMDLVLPLGKWFPVKRHSWFDVYKSPTALYWRPDTTIHSLKPTGTSGFYMVDGTVSTLPLDSHPISFQVMGDTIWTRRRHSMSPLPGPPSPPPGNTIRNDIQCKSQTLRIGCDASLHPGLNVATCAWVIEAQDDTQIQAHANILNISSHTTYRGELEGIYRSLRHIQTLSLDPPRVHQWCDNKAAIDNAAKTLVTPSQMTRPDADILLAISALRLKYAPCVITQTHVYGHQDARRARQVPDSPSPTSQASFSSLESATSTPPTTWTLDRDSNRLNILSDKIAGEAAFDVIRGSYPTTPTISPPYPGSKALLRIGETWITSHVSKHIAHASHSNLLREYCLKKYDWSTTTFDSIYWEGIGRARRRGTQTQLMHTSKLMHGWLPVNHVVGRYTGITQCPGCSTKDETIDHMFHCPHPQMVTARTESLSALRRFLIRAGTSRPFSDPFVDLFQSYLEDRVPHTPNYLAQEAYQAQLAIGHNLTLRGYLATEWLHLLRYSGHARPETAITNIIFHTWHDFFKRIWDARNNLLHRTQNRTTAALETSLDERLLWFLANRGRALSHNDQKMITFTRDDLPSMPLYTKKEWVRQLDAVKRTWAIERIQRGTGQTILTNFFSPNQNPEVIMAA